MSGCDINVVENGLSNPGPREPSDWLRKPKIVQFYFNYAVYVLFGSPGSPVSNLQSWSKMFQELLSQGIKVKVQKPLSQKITIKGQAPPFWQIKKEAQKTLYLKHWKVRTTVLEDKDKCLGNIVLDDKNKTRFSRI